MKRTATRVPTLQSQFRKLRSEPHRIVIPKPREVSAYFSKFRRLGRLVPEICIRVREELGPNVELSLEVYRDPEIIDQYLNLYVRQEEGYDSTFLDRTDKVARLFDEELHNVPGYLGIGTDFRAPGRFHV
jgi:hypothetical protein